MEEAGKGEGLGQTRPHSRGSSKTSVGAGAQLSIEKRAELSSRCLKTSISSRWFILIYVEEVWFCSLNKESVLEMANTLLFIISLSVFDHTSLFLCSAWIHFHKPSNFIKPFFQTEKCVT